ncbi:DUF2637 domain-containing protein [Streptomyces hydrogenans]|uniref:DUF2637 domain-containing protein n=1 Tax=Streptomyces hydrogenans TaxID=1873719 RepID=UPI0035D9C9A2
MLNLRALRDPIFIQAVIAAALSFSHIHDVADAAGQTGWKAWAYPISVDVLLAVAWQMMRARGGAAAWFWFLVAMAASLGANVATSGVMDLTNPPVWLRVIVAGWPAVAFLGGTLLVHRRRVEGAEEPTPPTVDEEPQEPAQGPADEWAEVADTEPAEELQKAVPAPELVTYRDAAELLNVAEVTVRGWAGRGLVQKYPGQGANGVRVSLEECRMYRASQLMKV